MCIFFVILEGDVSNVNEVKKWASWHTSYSNGSDGGIYVEYTNGKTESMQYEAVYGYGGTKRRHTTERQACAIAASRLPVEKEVAWDATMNQGVARQEDGILSAAWREQCDYEMSK
jgi:hypothetical protein